MILPACHEEQTIERVLDELHAKLDPSAKWLVAVGVNGSPPGADRTATLARQHPSQPLVAETPARGYGHGCQAAIDLIESRGLTPSAYLFFAADGANDPRDLAKLLRTHQEGHAFVLGCRTFSRAAENRKTMGTAHVFANRLLAAWCTVLTGHRFHDIGPLRLIERRLFHRLRLCEWTFGWTIEAQVRAVRLGASVVEVPVQERNRWAGEQKVSKVNWRQTLAIGFRIFLAGWRARWRTLAVPPEPISVNAGSSSPAPVCVGGPADMH